MKLASCRISLMTEHEVFRFKIIQCRFNAVSHLSTFNGPCCQQPLTSALHHFRHPECPERVSTVMNMAEKQGLLARCVSVEVRNIFCWHKSPICSSSRKEYVDLMTSSQKMTEEELKSLSESYDSIYIHPVSLTVRSVLRLHLSHSWLHILHFTPCRPPGHHAHVDKMNGYCMFNNLAIAARYAQKRHIVERVLIVDWDVHHGQGIQKIFFEDPSVLYFSVHRYQGGTFWPHLKESDSSAVGTGPGAGYNINLPWNQTGMKDGDYLAAFQQLLIPVAYEFQPQLVLVAAGFDSVIGDPKGEMSASPQCFAVLTHMLKGLAQGRLVMALEGGYNLDSTAKGACACLKSLLGDSCPPLHFDVRCVVCAEGGRLSTAEELSEGVGSERTGLVYDQRMMAHHNMWNSHHPEQPQRIFRIFSRHEDLGLVARCHRIPSRLATEEELTLCHGSEHVAKMKTTETMKPRDLHRLGDEYNSVYVSNESYHCALLAAGSCFNAAQAVLSGEVRNAVAIVRPPGHHAEKDIACGFCLFNTVALTARYAQKLSHGPLRVLILDWDVHHGNGTQHIFEEDDSVLYISLHRHENGTFFPFSEDGNFDKVGEGKGRGFNVNIAWNGEKMGDSEYLAAFHHVVMPIAREFAPQLVLVSAGFDAARGDPLGGYQVTPEGYAHLTHHLMTLAGGRMLIILEGGYNLTSISESMSMCTSMLLGDPPPLLSLKPQHPNAAVSINNVLRAHAPYWRSLRIQSQFPSRIPESLRRSLPSPKGKDKRMSVGKSNKSPRKAAPPQSSGHAANATAAPPSESPTSGHETPGIDDLTMDLSSLDLDTSSSTNSTTSSVPVQHATKLAPMLLKSEVSFRKCTFAFLSLKSAAETGPGGSAGGGQERSEPEGASGGSDKTGSMHIVDPLSWCPHLETVKPIPSGGIDVFQPCEDCGSDAENWICLGCYKVFCGRYVNQHMVTHGSVSGHPMVLSFADLSVWCYRCEAYVHNQVAKNAAHLSKFGEEVPTSK
uniref:Protein deacetylase HDAC6 n=1 Tax=Denticeps clupeoides TaxID=299321 RepID=A0AAY4EAY3_9TELE